MRKFVLFSASLICLHAVSTAQISKGSVYLGGGIGYSKTTEDRSVTPAQPQFRTEGELKAVVISPAIGIAVKQNLIAGINFSYGKSTQENFSGSNGKRENKVIGAGLFLRRYYPLAKRFYAFGEINAGYLDTETVDESYSSGGFFETYRTYGWSVSATVVPGLSYNVTNSFYLELGFADLFQVGYTKQTETQRSGVSNPTTYTIARKSFDISSSLFNSTNLNIGVRFIIPKK